MKKRLTAISLFSGAGGMDVGFEEAGIQVLWANEINKDAAKTYKANHNETKLAVGDINTMMDDIKNYKGVDIVFGGPPCQGFSVAGKMDPDDERSKLVWSFLDAVNIVQPKAFVMENVKALAKLAKWEDVRKEFFSKASEMGYECYPFLLNATEYGVPQKRERVFFVGIKGYHMFEEQLWGMIEHQKNVAPTIRQVLSHLGKAGTESNPNTCTAKITFATNPIIRKSPYAGMIFNGMGRPIEIDGYANTLPATMGGNKTPIIDEEYLYSNAPNNWIEEYHAKVLSGEIIQEFNEAPERLRRLTINEAKIIQTFPEKYDFRGSKSSIYKQIGNAVPCNLARAIANAVSEYLYEIKL